MTPPTRLSTALDERLDGLPAIPPERYLAAGRSVARRRRRGRVVAGVVVAGVLAAGGTLSLGGGPEQASEHAPHVAAPPTSTRSAPSLSNLRVEPGLGSIQSFTTDEIPAWATEYGHHGPVSIAPDGRLWVAPDATVVRSIDNPFDTAGQAAGVAHSYAVEVRWQGPDKLLGTDGLVWSFVYQDAGETWSLGELDSPDRWTADFGLWADDEVAGQLHRPSFAERLAHFADDRSTVLVPGADVTIVRQRADVATGDRQHHARETAAEVRIAGQTWFLLASGNRVGHDYYEAYDETSSGASDLDGFLRFLDSGSAS